MKNYYHKPEENRFNIYQDRTHIRKSGDFYVAFRADGSEITSFVIPMNICLMSLKGMLPGVVKIHPTLEEIEIEQRLKIPWRNN